MKNRHGLSRHIPPEIKYRIRKEAFFGCVHCGIAIGQYEHIDPEFSDAKNHDSSKMTFLCATENAKKRSGFTSKETVWNWKNNPYGLVHGHCHDSFDIGSDNFSIWLGASKIEKFEKVITVDDICLLSIKPPEEDNSPFRLSAIFHDNNDNKILEIIDNEWRAESDAFDIICVGGKIGIRQDGNFVLKLICFPPNQIVIEEIDMVYKGIKLKGNANSFVIDGHLKLENRALFTGMVENCSFVTFSASQPGITIGAGTQIHQPLKENKPIKPKTSHKCRRNEMCPCKVTGKKYKDCCYPKYDYVL